MAMLSRAASNCPASARHNGQGGASTAITMCWSSVRCSMSASDSSKALTSTALGCSTWRRAKASSLPVSSAPRLLARDAAATNCCAWASPASAGSSSSTCRLPWMTVSRLLKSWAIPPVNWPTLSRRWAWFSASSVLARCRLVASMLDSDSRKCRSSSPKRPACGERTASTPMTRSRSRSGTLSALPLPVSAAAAATTSAASAVTPTPDAICMASPWLSSRCTVAVSTSKAAAASCGTHCSNSCGLRTSTASRPSCARWSL